jgi:hypothetical protein
LRESIPQTLTRMAVPPEGKPSDEIEGRENIEDPPDGSQ